jgi:hypothetical protein
LAWIWWFGGAMARRAKPCRFLPFYNFVSSETSPTGKQDIQKLIDLISLKKLYSFVSYEFPLFNTSENHKSMTARAFSVPSSATPFRNLVLLCE